jgi:hypothetical protein
MPIGPGKYDDLATYVREQTEADGVAVIVMGGNKGNGFSVQCPADLSAALPEMLEMMAKEIRESMK